jgi:hypothetical protein
MRNNSSSIPADEEEDDADTDVGEQDAHPDLHAVQQQSIVTILKSSTFQNVALIA